MSEHTQAWHYVKTYLDAVKEFEGRLPERALHDRAQRIADKAKFVLTGDEKRKANKWLDERFPVRTKKVEEDKPPGLFDDVMRVE